MLEQNRENPPCPGEEITDWYIPAGETPREIEGCYIHATPLPERLRPTPPKKRRTRKRWWLCLAAAVILIAAVATGLLLLHHSRSVAVPPAESDSRASSIFNIFTESAPTKIPRAVPPQSLKLTITERGEELTPQEIYEKVSPATVIVLAQQGENTSVGTGVIMTEDGYIITNDHVIAGGESAGILLYGKYYFEAELVGSDANTDLAVLKALEAENFPTAEFGNSDLCSVGDTVYAIGNPMGIELYGTMSDGILSAINRDIQVQDHTVTVLQTTAALNNGNSGGPLINTSGQVIGINTLKMGGSNNASAQVEGLGFALPVSDASYVINDILATGYYRGAPTFGITVIGAQDADGKNIVVIYTVEENSAAAEADLREGDVILAVDDQDITTVAELLAIRRSHAVGDTVHLKIWRDGKTEIHTVTLRGVK